MRPPPSSFKCLPGCGACCTIVKLRPPVFDRLLEKVQRPIVRIYIMGEDLWPITGDLVCCFLRQDCACNIYEDRPQICRDSGLSERFPCPFLTPDGRPRPERSRDRILKKLKADLVRLKENLTNYQQRYGL